MVNTCQLGHTINIFCEGVVSNKDCPDTKQLGAASAVIYHEGRDFKHVERVYGETIMENDTRIRSLSPGLDVLTDFLSSQSTWNHSRPREVLLTFPHSMPIRKMLDTSPHKEQATTIKHLEQIGEILHSYPSLNIKLLSLPRGISFVGFKRAKQLAMEAIRMANINEIRKPQTIRNQKDEAERTAIDQWAERWHQSPQTSLVYRTVLTRPPNRKPHPM